MAAAKSCLHQVVHSNPLMKLVVMATLLLSDADVFFTFASFHSYLKKDFILGPILISVMVLTYTGGAYFGDKKKRQFCKVLRQNVEGGNYKKKDGEVLTMDNIVGETEHEYKKAMLSVGLANTFFQERAKFIRNIVKLKHSIPFFRLAKFGWMADIPAGDFAGILNANALYSFTLGWPQLGVSLYFSLMIHTGQPDILILCSLIISSLSMILSILNVVIAFPKVLNDLECQRDLQIEMAKDTESKIKGFIDGLQQERDAKLQQLIGKAEHTQEYIAVMQEYMALEKQLRDSVARMVQADYDQRNAVASPRLDRA